MVTYLKGILICALLCGVVTAAAYSVVQQVTTVPLILEAERFEQASPPEGGHAHDGHAHEEAAWQPADGWQRLLATLSSNVVLGVGFALLLTALASLQKRMDWKTGLVWGMAGFIVFFMAPAWMHTPALPGAEHGELFPRQAGWFMAVAVTAVALAVFYFSKAWWGQVAGTIALASFFILAPQQQAQYPSNELAALAGPFFMATTVSNAVFWLMLGLTMGWLLPRFLKP